MPTYPYNFVFMSGLVYSISNVYVQLARRFIFLWLEAAASPLIPLICGQGKPLGIEKNPRAHTSAAPHAMPVKA